MYSNKVAQLFSIRNGVSGAQLDSPGPACLAPAPRPSPGPERSPAPRPRWPSPALAQGLRAGLLNGLIVNCFPLATACQASSTARLALSVKPRPQPRGLGPELAPAPSPARVYSPLGLQAY